MGLANTFIRVTHACRVANAAVLTAENIGILLKNELL